MHNRDATASVIAGCVRRLEIGLGNPPPASHALPRTEVDGNEPWYFNGLALDTRCHRQRSRAFRLWSAGSIGSRSAWRPAGFAGHHPSPRLKIARTGVSVLPADAAEGV
jgi:hypothetical protein